MQITPDRWANLFILETPLLELIVRGTLLYLGILLLLRLMPRRSGGEIATMDLIFALLIADAASASLGDYTSVTDGLIIVIVVMGWNYTINTLSFHFPFIQRLVSAAPIQVVRDGQLLLRNMRREFLTEEELISRLRQQGIETVSEVKVAYVEGEGQITAIRRSDQ